MSSISSFLRPRMVGKRFAKHQIPLEVLKDLSTLESMVVEVAKWAYLEKHPERKRSPRGFVEGISLRLSAISPGSAIPEVDLVIDQPQLIPQENQLCFEDARDRIIGAIDAAEHGGNIDDFLPNHLLNYFDKLGRSLREDEAIEFKPGQVRSARLNKTTRRKLVLASTQIKDLSDEITLRGSVPEADQERMTFDLQIINGPRVSAPISLQTLGTVLDAFNGYKDGQIIQIEGIGRFNRFEKIQSIESIEHIVILDPMDVFARLDELKGLREGWLDGKGFAPSEKGLDWIADKFATYYPETAQDPFIYPTAEGGIQLEWTIGHHDVSLDISFDTYIGIWHCLNLESMSDTEKELNLESADDWQWITSTLHTLMETD